MRTIDLATHLELNRNFIGSLQTADPANSAQNAGKEFMNRIEELLLPHLDRKIT